MSMFKQEIFFCLKLLWVKGKSSFQQPLVLSKNSINILKVTI